MPIDENIFDEEDFTTEEQFIPELLPTFEYDTDFDDDFFGPPTGDAELDTENFEPEPETPDILGLETDNKTPTQNKQETIYSWSDEPPIFFAKENKELNTGSNEKKVKGVEKTGEHESLWSKIKNGFKKVREFFSYLSEAVKTQDITMFKAWVYGGKRLVNTLVETDITNNAIKQKEALEAKKQSDARIAELEKMLAEKEAQQADAPDISEEPDISDEAVPSSEEQAADTEEIVTTETEAAQQAGIFTAQMQSKFKFLESMVSQLEEEKSKGENADAERIAQLSNDIVVQYKMINDTVFFISQDAHIPELPVDDMREFVEYVKATAKASTDIVFETLKDELEADDLRTSEKEGDGTAFSDDTPSLRKKLDAINQENTSIIDQLAREMGPKEDPSSTIDKDEPSFDDDL